MLNIKSKIAIFLLRIFLGFMFFSSAFSKILNPKWTSAGYLQNAKTFTSFYQWLASPNLIKITDFLNEWGMLFIGLGLIFGLAVKLASFFGIIMMFLYYLPILQFPYADKNIIVDQHIIFILIFFLLIVFDAGKIWGLDSFRKRTIKI